ncbi:sensor histidine kinase [Streptomyces chartreusis]|uniref:histidine kinase n=1 Tax=Streptomyces chartreusis TaxID=1969 RepID=A0A7I0NSF7_STRCX|nr:sensor histidine kinase [Streptomyces chartreusis]QKZ16000.1 sensor histidine kinase [Streptomyces chartreusis]
MTSISGRGCAHGFAVGLLLAVSAVDVLSVGSTGQQVWPTVLVLLAGVGAILWPAARRPPWLTGQTRTATPALLSALYTAGSLLTGQKSLFGFGETAILLCLLFIAVRQCPPRMAVVCGALDGIALLATPVRYYHSLQGETLAFMMVGLVLVGLVAGSAAYLRSLDYRRTVAVVDTRREERLAIAADLHDFVAHHVTGILVQTQMARMMATTQPQELDPVLTGIERAAAEALASMRRTVGVLRDTGADTADHRPNGDLASIAQLTEGFAASGQKVTLHRAPDTDDLPHEVQAAAFRVVQEALTNVRRHAADATEIAISMHLGDGRLEVTVTDDGRGGAPLPVAAHGGGYGLVGLTERVCALGGEFTAEPRAEHGWQVRAWIPVGKH